MNSQRIVAVLVAALAGVLAWVLIEPVGGVDLMGPARSSRPQLDINAVAVAMSALVSTLIGWGVLALMERRARNPRRAILIFAVVGTILSLGAPFSGGGIDTGQRMLLLLLHLVVAAVFIPLMARTARADRAEA